MPEPVALRRTLTLPLLTFYGLGTSSAPPGVRVWPAAVPLAGFVLSLLLAFQLAG